MENSYISFRRFRSEVIKKYQSKDYAAALNLIDLEAGSFPEEQAQIAFWQVFLLALSEKTGMALATLRQAIDAGYWYSPQSLQEDTDLASLQDNPEFKRLAVICAERFHEASQKTSPEWLLAFPANDAPKPYPLLVTLHGRSTNAAKTLPFWQSVCARGWTVAALQSSQVIGMNSYCWDDQERAIREVKASLAELLHSYPLDQDRVLLGGFSQGGGLAIWLALQRLILCRGFIAVAPFLPEAETMTGNATQRTVSSLQGFLVTGELDSYQQMFDQIEKRLLALQIACQRERYPELGHEYPPEFDRSLEKALDFIFGGA